MRRPLRPTLDSLESKALLAVGTVSLAPYMHMAAPTAIRVEPTVVHPTTVARPAVIAGPPMSAPVTTTPGPSSTSSTSTSSSTPSSTTSISATLTTDKTTYNAGDKVTISLTETNTSNQAVTIEYGPSADGFSVTQNGATIWRSNAGPQPMFMEAITLQPGESHTFTAIWNDYPNSDASPSGITSGGFATGTFQVNANFPGLTVAPVTITVN